MTRLYLPVNVVPRSIDTIKSGFSAIVVVSARETRLMDGPSKNKTKTWQQAEERKVEAVD